MLKPIAVFGVGGFGLEVAMLIEQINAADPQWKLVGFFDDDYSLPKEVNGYPVLGNTDALNSWDKRLSVALGIGMPKVRRLLCERIDNSNVHYPNLIHPSVIMGAPAYLSIGQGCIICAGSIITTNIQIGDQVVLNLACTVGHETKIGSYSAFMPTCNISGEVEVGEENFWGTGAKVINRIKVGDRVTVGAGAVVINDLPAGVTAVGVPAKIISKPS